MTRVRLLTYLVGGLFFFSTIFTFAYLFFPDIRDGAEIFAGVILGQFVAAIVGLAAREIVETEIKKTGPDNGGGGNA